mmetsp:Transcript_30629/g.56610  ORF Transcript_30629/g.56610 Transcript_30629/m.56610 type:complete len:348 (+) Transcript_30629:607-1650(+)
MIQSLLLRCPHWETAPIHPWECWSMSLIQHLIVAHRTIIHYHCLKYQTLLQVAAAARVSLEHFELERAATATTIAITAKHQTTTPQDQHRRSTSTPNSSQPSPKTTTPPCTPSLILIPAPPRDISSPPSPYDSVSRHNPSPILPIGTKGHIATSTSRPWKISIIIDPKSDPLCERSSIRSRGAAPRPPRQTHPLPSRYRVPVPVVPHRRRRRGKNPQTKRHWRGRGSPWESRASPGISGVGTSSCSFPLAPVPLVPPVAVAASSPRAALQEAAAATSPAEDSADSAEGRAITEESSSPTRGTIYPSRRRLIRPPTTVEAVPRKHSISTMRRRRRHCLPDPSPIPPGR